MAQLGPTATVGRRLRRQRVNDDLQDADDANNVGGGCGWSERRVTVWENHSHSVVPGGFEVRSNRTREIPLKQLISSTIFCRT